MSLTINRTEEASIEGFEEEMVSLQSLAELTGFPIELLKNELLLEGKVSLDDKISLQELRKVMCYYLNSAMSEKVKIN